MAGWQLLMLCDILAVELCEVSEYVGVCEFRR